MFSRFIRRKLAGVGYVFSHHDFDDLYEKELRLKFLLSISLI